MDYLSGLFDRYSTTLTTVRSQFNMIEIAHILVKDNIVVDALSRYPQENGPCL